MNLFHFFQQPSLKDRPAQNPPAHRAAEARKPAPDIGHAEPSIDQVAFLASGTKGRSPKTLSLKTPADSKGAGDA
jgi:hypothetical protein